MKYDPNKSYTWKQDDKFEMSGAEFGLILNTLRATLSTEEAKKIQMTLQASNVLESILSKAVESGVAIENVPPAPMAAVKNE